MADSWSHGYNSPFQSPYINPPPLAPPAPSHYDQYAPSPNIQYAEPGSPLVYPVSPAGSPPRSRDSSQHRPSALGEPYIGIPDDRGRERMYHNSHLVVGAGSQSLSRSGSERSRPGHNTTVSYVQVANSANNRGRHGRSPSGGSYYYEGGKKYSHNAAGSTYSNSSYESRSHSKVRHSRSPSCDSCDSWEDHNHNPESRAMAPYRPRKADEEKEELTAKLRTMEQQLQQLNMDTQKRKEDEERKRKEEENSRLDKLRVEEIERKVSEKLQFQRKKEAEAAAEKARKDAAEKARIKEEAEKIIRERAEAEEAKKRAEEAEKAKIQAIIDQERQKYEAMNKGRRTYTKFSKVHLCKEALDERSIAYTEESDHFLVHRVVDKTEQNYLWARTKEIRNYYRQIQEAADRAPTVRTAEGNYVKYVQIAGQPYPIALPVTFTQTPGGGQTQRVDPIKIKWSDIFKPSKF